MVEDLQVSGMSRSAKGTAENPGRTVRAKSGLNRSILDQGWFEFRRQLGYKLDWLGGELVRPPPPHVSEVLGLRPCVGGEPGKPGTVCLQILWDLG